MNPHHMPVGEASDRDLLLRFAMRSDAGALAALAERHERSLLGLARGLLGGRETLACEAVQAMWLKVIRDARSFEGRSSVKTWLYRIVVNQCRDLRKREMKGRARAAGNAEPAERTRAPSAGAEAIEIRQIVAGAVASLTEAQR